MPTHKTCVQVANFVIQRMKCMCVRVGIAFGCVWNVFFSVQENRELWKFFENMLPQQPHKKTFYGFPFFRVCVFLVLINLFESMMLNMCWLGGRNFYICLLLEMKMILSSGMMQQTVVLNFFSLLLLFCALFSS